MLRSFRLRLAARWPTYLLLTALLAALGFFIWHLFTKQMPERVAFSIFGVDIFWSAFLYTAVIFLATAVVAHIARHNGRRQFDTAVPPTIQQQPLNTLPLDLPNQETLQRRRYRTVGVFLWWWGLTPRYLGMPDQQLQALGETLLQDDTLQGEWLIAPAWRPYDPFHAWRSLLWLLGGGLLGGRLYHILFPPPSLSQFGIMSPADFFQNPVQLISLRDGGLGFYGAFLGGLLGLLLYTLRHRLPFLLWADFAVVGVAWGQALGRWGNFINQEWIGYPTTLPWAVMIDLPYRLPLYQDFSSYHPLFLYESLWAAVLFLLLYHLALSHYRHLRRGDLLALYTIGYSLGRLLWEPLRLDSASFGFGGLSLSAAFVTALSLLFLMAAWRRFSYLS